MLNQDAVDLRTRVEPLNLRAELGLSDGLVEVNVLRVEASRRACFVLLADVSDAGRIVADQYRREPGTYSFVADSTFTDMGTSGVRGPDARQRRRCSTAVGSASSVSHSDRRASSRSMLDVQAGLGVRA